MRYFVTVTRDTTESTVITVDAANMTAARDVAIEKARNEAGAYNWVPDDCTGGDPYLADPDEKLQTADDDADDDACGQCDGTGTTDAMGRVEQCPVCDGTGTLQTGEI
jgi:hypothetical protein